MVYGGEAGKPALIELLSGFSCPENPDVELRLLGYVTLA